MSARIPIEIKRFTLPAYGSGGYTMREIGEYFGLSQSRISKIIRPAPPLGSRTKG